MNVIDIDCVFGKRWTNKYRERIWNVYSCFKRKDRNVVHSRGHSRIYSHSSRAFLLNIGSVIVKYVFWILLHTNDTFALICFFYKLHLPMFYCCERGCGLAILIISCTYFMEMQLTMTCVCPMGHDFRYRMFQLNFIDIIPTVLSNFLLIVTSYNNFKLLSLHFFHI